MRLNLCFDDSSKTLKTDQELLKQHLTLQEIQAWRAMKSEVYQEVRDWLTDPLNCVVSYDDDIYPASLRTIKDPPLLLFCRGNCSLLNRPQLAVVGSRSPSQYGKQVVREWIGPIANRSLVISSGFAYGIDYLAHQSALAAGGNTLAVLGSGLIDVYPRGHHETWGFKQLAEHALMVSEFPLSFPVRPWLFPYRNRIISGLSIAVLVVEARIKSGTLITARWAAEQGREVIVVPGSVHNPLSAGCHRLLQQGATIVSSVADVLDTLRWLGVNLDSISPDKEAECRQSKTCQRANGVKSGADGSTVCGEKSVFNTNNILECHAKKLLDCLEFGVVNSVEEILQRTGLDLLQTKRYLVLLEDGGWVQELVDGYVRLK